MTLLGRDVAEVEALVTDRYLDALLASGELAVLPGGRLKAGSRNAPGGLRLDAAVRLASARLTRDLPRFHPSFRFEERLAVRLAEAAAAMRLPAAAGAEGSVAVIPSAPPAPVELIDPFGDPGRGAEGSTTGPPCRGPC